MIALNNVGSSPPSEPLSLRTAGEAPSTAPHNIRGTPLTSRSVRVSWTPPDRATWHGALQGYYVGFRRLENETPLPGIYFADKLTKYYIFTICGKLLFLAIDVIFIHSINITVGFTQNLGVHLIRIELEW